MKSNKNNQLKTNLRNVGVFAIILLFSIGVNLSFASGIAAVGNFNYINNGTALFLNDSRFNVTLEGSAANISMNSWINETDPSNLSIKFEVDFDYDPTITVENVGILDGLIDWLAGLLGYPPEQVVIDYGQNVSLKINCASLSIQDDELKTIQCEGYTLNYQDANATGWNTYPTEIEGKKVKVPMTNKSWAAEHVGKRFKIDPTVTLSSDYATVNYERSPNNIIRASSTTLYAIARASDYTTCIIAIFKSTDNGLNWVNNTYSFGNGCGDEDIAILPNGNVIGGWSNTSSDKAWFANFSTGTYVANSAKEVITTGFANARGVDLLHSNSNTNLLLCFGGALRCANSTNGGTTWSGYRSAFNTSTIWSGYDIYTSPVDGSIHFLGYNVTSSLVQYGNSSDFFNTLSYNDALVITADAISINSNTRIIITQDGLVHLFAFNTTSLLYRNSTGGWASKWVPIFSLNSTVGNHRVAVTADLTNQLHLTIVNTTALQYMNITNSYKTYGSIITIGTIAPDTATQQFVAMASSGYPSSNNQTARTYGIEIFYTNTSQILEYQNRSISLATGVPVYTVTNNTPMNTTYTPFNLGIPYSISFTSSDSSSATCQYSLNGVLGSQFSMVSGGTNTTTLTGVISDNYLNTTCTNVTNQAATGSTALLHFELEADFKVVNNTPQNATYTTTSIPYNVSLSNAYGIQSALCQYSLNGVLGAQFSVIANLTNATTLTGVVGDNTINSTCTNSTVGLSNSTALLHFEVHPSLTVTSTLPANATYQVYNNIPYSFSYTSTVYSGAYCSYTLNSVETNLSYVANNTVTSGLISAIANSQGNNIFFTCTNASTSSNSTTTYFETRYSITPTQDYPANTTYTYLRVPYQLSLTSSSYPSVVCQYTLNGVLSSTFSMANNTQNLTTLTGVIGGNTINSSCSNGTTTASTALRYFEIDPTLALSSTAPTNSTYLTASVPYSATYISSEFGTAFCGYTLDSVFTNLSYKTNNTAFSGTFSGLTVGGHSVNFTCTNTTYSNTTTTTYFEFEADGSATQNTPTNTTYYSYNLAVPYSFTFDSVYGMQSALCQYSFNGNLGTQFSMIGNTTNTTTLTGILGGNTINTTCVNSTIGFANATGVKSFELEADFTVTHTAPTNTTYTYFKFPYTASLSSVFGVQSALCQYSLNGVLGSQFSVAANTTNSTTLTGIIGDNYLNTTCVNSTVGLSNATALLHFEIDPTLSLTSSAPTNSTYLTASVPYSATFVSSEFGTAFCGYTLDSVFTNLSYQTNNSAFVGTLSGLTAGGHNINFNCANTTYSNTTSTVYFEVEIDGSTIQNTPTNTTYTSYNLAVPYSFTFNNVYGMQSVLCQYSLNGVLGSQFSLAGNSTNTTTLTGTLGANTVNTTCTNTTVGFTNNTGLVRFELEADFTVVNNTPQNTTYRTTWFDYSMSLNNAYAIQSALCQYSLNGVLGSQFSVVANSSNTTRLTGTIGSNTINTSCSNSSVGFSNSTTVLNFDLNPRITVANYTPQNTTYNTFDVPYSYTFTSEEYSSAYCGYTLDAAFTNLSLIYNNTAMTGTLPVTTNGGHNVYMTCTNATITGTSNTTYFAADVNIAVSLTSPSNVTYLQDWAYLTFTPTSNFFTSFTCNRTIDYVPTSIVVSNNTATSFNYTGLNNLNAGNHTISVSCGNGTVLSNQPSVTFNLIAWNITALTDDDPVYETSLHPFNANINVANNINTIDVYLVYNETAYGLVTKTFFAPNTWQLTRSINIPLIYSNGTVYNWRYNVNYTFTNATVYNSNTSDQTETVNYAYWISAYSASTIALEGTPVAFTTNISNYATEATLNVSYLLNGTLGYGTPMVYNYWTGSINAPTIFNDSLILQSNSTLNVTYGVNTRTMISENANTTVFKLGLTNCTGGAVALNITFRDEVSNTPINITSDATFTTIEPTNPLIQTNYTFSFTNVNNTALCINPANATAVVDSVQVYYNASTYPQRSYFLLKLPISNNTQNLSLYLRGSSIAKLTEITLVNSVNLGYPNAYLAIERAYPGENIYKTIAMAKTSDAGLATTYLEPNDPWYKFVVYNYDGTIINEFSPLQISCGSSTDKCTLTLRLPGDVYGVKYEQLGALNWRCGFDNSSNISSCNFTDTSGITRKIRYECDRVVGGYALEKVAMTEVSASSATIYHQLNDTNTSHYTCTLSIAASPYINIDIMSIFTGVYQNSFGDVGKFLGLGILLTAGFLGVASPILSIVGLIAGTVIVNVTGLMAFGDAVPYILISGAVAIMIYFWKGER